MLANLSSQGDQGGLVGQETKKSSQLHGGFPTPPTAACVAIFEAAQEIEALIKTVKTVQITRSTCGSELAGGPSGRPGAHQNLMASGALGAGGAGALAAGALVVGLGARPVGSGSVVGLVAACCLVRGVA